MPAFKLILQSKRRLMPMPPSKPRRMLKRRLLLIRRPRLKLGPKPRPKVSFYILCSI